MQNEIQKLWDGLSSGGHANEKDKALIQKVIAMLDAGEIKVVEKKNGEWIVNVWLKQAILLYFKISSNKMSEAGLKFYDKIPLKTEEWDHADFTRSQFRSVAGSVVRYGSFIGKSCVLMPSFVNIGAHVGDGTMIDTWATVGSCAQIGRNCHISGGVGIGGVLEPLQANPVIIEDNVFIGARSEIAEGVVVSEGSVISMGVFIGASTRIYDRESGMTHYGVVPPYSVVVSGTMPSSDGKTHTYAAIIVKKVDEKTRSKVGVNEILREV